MANGQTVKIAGIQFAAKPDVARNVRRALDMLDAAAERGARMAILSELWAYPWFVARVDETARAWAEPATGPLLGAMREKAAQRQLFVICPWYERDDETGRTYNSAALIDAQGEIAGVYRKMHVPSAPGWEERHYFSPGDRGFGVFDTPAGKTAILLGWDVFFPEALREAVLAGAQLIAAPLAATAANDDLWRRAALAGAFANGCWLLRVGRVGKENGMAFAGASFCAAPTGDLLDEPASDGEAVVFWDLDPRAPAVVRRDWPFLRDRRPDQYAALTVPTKTEDQT